MEQVKKDNVFKTDVALAEADLDSLVSMCHKCRLVVKRHLFIKSRYYYFVTNDEGQIETVFNIFKQYGIVMDKHMSKINSRMNPQMVLRISERRTSKAAKEMFGLIERKRIQLFNSRFYASEYNKKR